MSREITKEIGNFSPWLWVTALAPMMVCGVTMVIVFAFNLVSFNQSSQQKSLTSTRARLTSNAISLTSGARYKTTEQARIQTATAILQPLYDAERYPIIFSDSFDTNNKGWLTGSFRDNKESFSIEGGKYLWQDSNSSELIKITALEISPTSKFYLSVEVRNRSISTTDYYGLAFRKTGESFYCFGIDSSQNLQVFLKQDNQLQTLIYPQKNMIIRNNDVNRLVVIGDGPNYLFYINEQFVGRMTDTKLSGSEFGMATKGSKLGSYSTLEFDDFEFRAPPSSGLPTSTPMPTSTRTPTFVRVTPKTITPTPTH